jgi:hypothetical protein
LTLEMQNLPLIDQPRWPALGSITTFAPILAAEDDVVLARINDMVVRLVSFDHA